MRAVYQSRYGPPAALEVRDVPTPEPGPGEVLVEVRAASLHPDVWHVVAGWPWALRLMGGGFRRPRQPIPGTDMAGVVVAVGDGATRFRPGDAVFGETSLANAWNNGGAFAEYVAVPEALLARKPEGVGFAQAAAVPSAGLIALQNLPDADWLNGRAVLIVGAGGGVGSLALQIAKASGARVTAVDTTGKLDLLRELGADEVIDYTVVDVLQSDRRFDYIFDVPAARHHTAYRHLLTADGRYVPIGHEAYGRSGKRVWGLLPYFIGLTLRVRFDDHLGTGRRPAPGKAETIVVLRDLLATGALTPRIDRVYAFDEIHAAFRHLMDDELRGKIILTPTTSFAGHPLEVSRAAL